MNLGEAVETFLTEKIAKCMRPVRHADIVVNCPPEWVRASAAEFFFGIKRNTLNDLVAERKVVAKKADRLVLYRYEDIEKAIWGMRNVVRKGNAK